MSSTLLMRRTPKPDRDVWHFKLPVKAWIARRYYDHDGSCGGGTKTLSAQDLDWMEGVLDAGAFPSAEERAAFEQVVEILRQGDTIDMWFET